MSFFVCGKEFAMIINGENCTLPQPVSLLELLQTRGYNPARVAVERGGEIVKQNEYAAVIITDADRLEIVSFVGGG